MVHAQVNVWYTEFKHILGRYVISRDYFLGSLESKSVRGSLLFIKERFPSRFLYIRGPRGSLPANIKLGEAYIFGARGATNCFRATRCFLNDLRINLIKEEEAFTSKFKI